MHFCYKKKRAEQRSCCDVTGQQASHGSCEAADSYLARLRRQFCATTDSLKRFIDQLLDRVSHVHQQRRQLLHLPGGEQGIQERDENYDKHHIKESTTWKRARNIRAVPAAVIVDCLTYSKKMIASFALSTISD